MNTNPSPTHPKKKRIKNSYFAVMLGVATGGLLAVVAIAGYYQLTDRTPSRAGEIYQPNISESEAKKIVESNSGYPEAFIEKQFPQYPGGESYSPKSAPNQNNNTFAVSTTTRDDSEKIIRFYDEELTKRGWEKATNLPESSEGMTLIAFKKGEETITVRVTKVNDTNVIGFSWVGKIDER